MWIQMLLNTEAFSFATNGIAGYVGVVRALGYAIAAVIVVVGSFSVYMDYMEENPDIRAKVTKLSFSCLFLVAASTSLPLFFGLDGSSSASFSGGGAGGGSSSSGSLLRSDGSFFGSSLTPYVLDLSNGGSAVIWVDESRCIVSHS